MFLQIEGEYRINLNQISMYLPQDAKGHAIITMSSGQQFESAIALKYFKAHPEHLVTE